MTLGDQEQLSTRVMRLDLSDEINLGTAELVDGRILMTEKQIKMLYRNIEKWESAPKVDTICEGKVWRKNNITTFKFKYDSPRGSLCDAEYKIRVDKDNAKSTQHKFECTEIPKKDPEEEDFD